MAIARIIASQEQTCQLCRETPGFDLFLPVSWYFLLVACFNCYEVMEYFPDSNIWQEIVIV
jgi:hypothetical protein